MLNKNTVYKGNCLELMTEIDNKSIDMILCDLPYGVTACKWDVIIPFEQLWKEYERIITDNGAIVLTATQPFTSHLIMSNIKMFKYCWYWKKSKPNGWQHSKNKPMTTIEELCVFSKAPMGHVSLLGNRRMNYFPRGIAKTGEQKKIDPRKHGPSMGSRPNQVGREYEVMTGFPRNLLEFASVSGKNMHPTQKPVDLFEYMINTYTQVGDLVLDNCCGSGTTGVACQNTGRDYILMELDEKYIDITNKRLEENKDRLND